MSPSSFPVDRALAGRASGYKAARAEAGPEQGPRAGAGLEAGETAPRSALDGAALPPPPPMHTGSLPTPTTSETLSTKEVPALWVLFGEWKTGVCRAGWGALCVATSLLAWPGCLARSQELGGPALLGGEDQLHVLWAWGSRQSLG